MNVRPILILICLSTVAIASAADPASQPAPGVAAPTLSPRQQNLLMQLSDAEANIQAINKALKSTGYSVGTEYDRIDSNRKANEIMSRKGGGPVRWDEFYGSTAAGYPRTGIWNTRMDDHRPQQFAFIYKANNDQIAHAKSQIAALMKDQQALLARRRKHENDQSELWATLAWEQVKDREIQYRPLYRFTLKPAGQDTAVLGEAIQFLRTADSVANEGLDSIAKDQNGTFSSGSKKINAQYVRLQQSLADALNAPGLKADHARDGQALKDLCKAVAEQCKVIADDYTSALDRDKAKEDDSKLEFRGQLQSALSSFAIQVENLDDEITRLAGAWGVTAERSSTTQSHGDMLGTGVANVPDGQGVVVHYASGIAEISTLKEGVNFYKDRKFHVKNLPDEMNGLSFAAKNCTDDGAVNIECAAGSTVYLMVDIGFDTDLKHPAHSKFIDTMTGSGWTRVNENGLRVDRYHAFICFKQTVEQSKHVAIPGIVDPDQGSVRSGAITVASAKVKIGDESK